MLSFCQLLCSQAKTRWPSSLWSHINKNLDQNSDCLVIVASGTEPPYSWKLGILHSVWLKSIKMMTISMMMLIITEMIKMMESITWGSMEESLSFSCIRDMFEWVQNLDNHIVGDISTMKYQSIWRTSPPQKKLTTRAWQIPLPDFVAEQSLAKLKDSPPDKRVCVKKESFCTPTQNIKVFPRRPNYVLHLHWESF